jgi:hypothetical protein
VVNGQNGQHDVVRRLFFGRDDAENDLADGLLRAGFLSTAAYEAALTGRKSLIIGRKGSGKSAICRRLASKDVGGYEGSCILITPDDAAGDEIRRFELQGLTPDTAKSLIWRYVFAVQAARHLVVHARDVRRRPPGAVRALRAFLELNDEAGEERLYDRLRRGARGLRSATLSLNAFGVVEASIEMGGASEGARAARQLEVLERGVAAAFAELGWTRKHPPLLFLVDQLEQVWTTDPDSRALVTGLLLAAKQLTSEYGRAARCVLFLRSDIYDTLNFTDGDKFRSEELRISWSKQGLRELALARVRACLARQVPDHELWSTIFPTTVQGEFTPDYLFSRILLRPRDAIQFLTLCRDTAAENGHLSVREQDVVDATLQFSQWKLNDLVNEYLVNYPFLRALFALFENNGHVVTREELETRYAGRRVTLCEEFPGHAQHLTPQGVIDALFSINFLGVRRGEGVVYAGGSRAPVQPDESEFHVHACFRRALGSVGPPPWAPQRSDEEDEAGFDRDPQSSTARSYQISRRRVLNRIGTSALPAAAKDALLEEVARRLPDAEADENPLVLRFVANYLRALAKWLEAEEDTDQSLVRLLDDEGRALRIALDGATEGSSGSSSPPDASGAPG